MRFSYILIGIILVMAASFGRAVSLEGSCSSVSYQCDLSVNDLKVCNNSTGADTYSVSVSGEAAAWINVIPSTLYLEPGECSTLHAYTIAECYAEPGTYWADITVKDGSSATVRCNIQINQGHSIAVEVIPESQTATQCEEKEYTVRLTNNGLMSHQQTEHVALEITGIDQDWVSLGENSIFVTKGSPEDVGLKIQAPCDAKLGEYPFEAVATLVNPNFTFSDSAKYILVQGQNIAIDTGIAGAASVCREEPGSMAVTITNKGKLEDTIALSLSAPGWAKLSTTRFTLAAGMSKSVTLEFDPKDAPATTHTLVLTARSEGFGYDTSANIEVRLQDCYGLKVEKVSGPEESCVEETPKYVFRVTNTGTEAANAVFSIEGIKAGLDHDSATISAGSSVDVSAELDISGLAHEAEVTRRDNNVAVEIVMDSSGSMVEKIEGTMKIDIAKDAATAFANSAKDVELGLRVFGQGTWCEPSELIAEVKALEIPEITAAISTMAPKGKTPMAEALMQSKEDFPAGSDKYVILVSDGRETCDGNTEAAARELKQGGIIVYAIGFDIDTEGKAQLQRIVGITGGKYYDAEDSAELSSVFQQIGVELNIIPASAGSRTFSFIAAAEKARAEEQFSIKVEDCYNTVLIAPSLNVCRGLETGDVLEIRNLGTERQAFEISAEPAWVSTESRVEIDGGKAVTIPLKANPPEMASESELKVVLKSANSEVEDSGTITYLPETSCFAIELINLNSVLDANACDGETFSIYVENRGMAKQTVSLSTDKAWVYVEPQSIELEKGERKEVFLIISPPYDLQEKQALITITAKTNYGFTATTKIKLNIFGAEAGLHKVELAIRDVNVMSVGKGANAQTELEFTLFNDSNRMLKIYGMESLGAKASFETADDIVEGKSGTRVSARVATDLNSGKITVPIKFVTDEGTFVRELVVTKPAETAPAVEPGTGLASLGDLGGIVIGILAAIVVALIAYGMRKGKRAAEPQKQKLQQKEPEKRPAAAQAAQPAKVEKQKPQKAQSAKKK